MIEVISLRQVYYDTPFNNRVRNVDNMEPDDYIDSVFSHVQANFCDIEALGTKFQVEV